ncbi:endonuclease-reverse transcriptase [Apostichopus japonicus]|uniref:Endonuclease-reverse transcriptase n=1 Tax=Stichopus japonicus TaxID=307972 RepID=A0A2G8JS34_STIJA|nr:endonuclease-reverse transcriptase [Apostichopus japonicus]
MKRGKAPGQDNIMIDALIEAGDAVDKELAKLFTAFLHQGKVPQKWKDANMIILHKKGDKRDLKNYRPISILSNIYKLFTKILINRLERLLDDNQPREQEGFRRNFSTTDHIHTLNQLKEKCQEFNIPVCVAFVDYEKAFDSVETWAVLEALKEQDINPDYIKVIKDIYTGSTTTVKLHKESNKIPIRKGVRQGDTISPKLFTACLEHIFKDISWEDKGINVNGEKFNHLRFADDIVIIANNFNEMEIMLQDLDIASRKRGLKMNMKKTKVMADQSVKHKPIIINGTEL